MTPWFRGERVEVLRAVAERWIGTPWVYGSESLGHGTDCGRLCRAIYQEAGFLSGTADLPGGFGSRQLLRLVPMLEGRIDLARSEREAMAGDLCVFFADRIHFALMVSGQEFIHCLRGCGTVVASVNDAGMMCSLHSLWTPVDGGCGT